MRLFIDTNIILDIYLDRVGAVKSKEFLLWCEENEAPCSIALHTLSNAFYVITKNISREMAWQLVESLLSGMDVVQLTNDDISQTRGKGMSDFEDALQIVSAEVCGSDCIITRNTRDFTNKTTVPVLTPEIFLEKYRV